MMILEEILPDKAERQLFGKAPRHPGIQARIGRYLQRGQAPDEIGRNIPCPP